MRQYTEVLISLKRNALYSFLENLITKHAKLTFYILQYGYLFANSSLNWK